MSLFDFFWPDFTALLFFFFSCLIKLTDKKEVIIDLYKGNWIHEFLTMGYSLTSLNSIKWACSFFEVP